MYLSLALGTGGTLQGYDRLSWKIPSGVAPEVPSILCTGGAGGILSRTLWHPLAPVLRRTRQSLQLQVPCILGTGGSAYP